MDRVLEQFDCNESALLMYLADELPESDRWRIDSALARDPALGEQLESLRNPSLRL